MSEVYSVLNNYTCENKPVQLIYLDLASSPIRTILGGKNVYLFRQESFEGFPSRALKVAAFALLIFLTPKFGCFMVGFSLTALVIKQIHPLQSNEIKKIQVQLDKYNKKQENALIFDQFNAASKGNNCDEVIQLFQTQQPLRSERSYQQTYLNALKDRFCAKSNTEKVEALSLVLSPVRLRVFIADWAQEKISMTFHKFLELEELLNALYPDNKEMILACYKEILNSSYVIEKKKHINYLNQDNYNQILFIDAIISKIEELEEETITPEEHRIDKSKEREESFEKITHFAFNEEDYTRQISEIKEYLTTLRNLEVLQESLIQHINAGDTKKFAEDLKTVCDLVGEKMPFDRNDWLKGDEQNLTQALNDKVSGNLQNLNASKNTVLEGINKYNTQVIFAQGLAKKAQLTAEHFHLIGHYNFESYRIYNLFVTLTQHLYK